MRLTLDLQRHISEVSHRALADMLSLFVRKELCETRRRDMLPPPPQLEKNGPWPVEEDLVKLPPQTLFGSVSGLECPSQPLLLTFLPAQWLRDERPKPVTPLCQSTSAPFSPLVPLSHSKTFKKVEWNEKSAWISSIPGSQIRFRFTGSKVGIFVYVTNGSGKDEASPDPKIRRTEAPGSALCWVEEPEMDEKEWEAKFATGGPEAAESQSWIVNTHWPQKAASGSECVPYGKRLSAAALIDDILSSQIRRVGGRLARGRAVRRRPTRCETLTDFLSSQHLGVRGLVTDDERRSQVEGAGHRQYVETCIYRRRIETLSDEASPETPFEVEGERWMIYCCCCTASSQLVLQGDTCSHIADQRSQRLPRRRLRQPPWPPNRGPCPASPSYG